VPEWPSKYITTSQSCAASFAASCTGELSSYPKDGQREMQMNNEYSLPSVCLPFACLLLSCRLPAYLLLPPACMLNTKEANKNGEREIKNT